MKYLLEHNKKLQKVSMKGKYIELSKLLKKRQKIEKNRS